MAEPTNQNLNQSPSPGGDGVQSVQSEKAAAGVDTVNQPAQQRINAAERRERGDAAKAGDKVGERPSLIQSPGLVSPTDVSADAINAAEKERHEFAERERGVNPDELPQQTIDEMEAGRAALGRNKPKKAEAPAKV